MQENNHDLVHGGISYVPHPWSDLTQLARFPRSCWPRLILLCFSLNFSITHTCFRTLLSASVTSVIRLELAAVMHLSRVHSGYGSPWWIVKWLITNIHCYVCSQAAFLNCFLQLDWEYWFIFSVYTNCVQALDGNPAVVFYQLYHSN